jgi:hypothetical protein
VKKLFNRHCLLLRGESHDTTVSIVGITLQQRRVNESIDFTDGVHGGVCIDVRRGRCCAGTLGIHLFHTSPPILLFDGFDPISPFANLPPPHYSR